MLWRWFSPRARIKHPNPKVRRSAVEKLPDNAEDEFVKVIKLDSHIDNRLAALLRIKSVETLARLLESEVLRPHVAERILVLTNRDHPLRSDPRIREVQLNQAGSVAEVLHLTRNFEDSKDVASAYLLVKTPTVRNALIKTKIDPEILVACEKLSRNKDKTLNRASRDRLAEYKSLVKSRKETDLQAKKLTAQALALARKDPHIHAKVDAYTHEWKALLSSIEEIDSRLEMYEVPKRDIGLIASQFPQLALATTEPTEPSEKIVFEQLYNQLCKSDGLEKTVFQIEQNWIKQADSVAPPKGLAKSFHDRCLELRHEQKKLERARRFENQAKALIAEFDLPNPNTGGWKSYWKTADKISKNLQAVRNIKTKIRWEDDSSKPDWIDALDRHYSRLISLTNDIEKTRTEMHQVLNRMIIELEEKVTEGELRSGFSLYKKTRSMLLNLPEHEQSKQQKRISSQLYRLKELQDWQSFAELPKRSALLEQMKQLADSPLEPLEQHKHIKQCRAEWNNLDYPQSSIQLKLQKRFDESAELAFEPCRRHFRWLAELRQKNIEQKRKICSDLEIFVTSTDWLNTDLKVIDTKLRTVRKKWRELSPTDRRSSQRIDSRFSKLTKSLHDDLNAQWEINRQRKEDLVKEAHEVFAQKLDIYQLVEHIKLLQKRWTTAGPIPQRTEDKLWQEFRSVCDRVFENRDRAKMERSSLLKKNIALTKHLKESAEIALKQSIKSNLSEMPLQLQKLESTLAHIELEKEPRKKFNRDLRSLQDKWNDHLDNLDKESRKQRIEQILHLDKRLATLEDLGDDTTEIVKYSGVHAKCFDGRSLTNINLKELNELVIKAELQANIPSPDSEKSIRLKIQVEHLNERLAQRNKEIELVDELLVRWCQTAYGKNTLRERFHRAVIRAATP